MKRLVETMDSLNLRVMLLAENVSAASGWRRRSRRSTRRRTRIASACSPASTSATSARAGRDKAIQQLEADIKAGALGVGEVGKQFGLRTTKPDGSRLKVDDPELDPLWDAFARLDVPAFIHTAEPQEFFQPLDIQERALARAVAVCRSPQQPARAGRRSSS